jgi:hypothetical protein
MSMPAPLPPVDGYAADIYSAADPSTWDWRLALTRFVGLDIGMRSDHSAFVVLGAWRTAAGITMAPIDSRQFPLQTPYDDVAVDTAAAHQQYDAKVIVDCSNAAPFLGLLAPRMRDPKNNLVAATITSARDHNPQPAKHLVGLGAAQIAIPLFALGKMPLLQAINFAGAGRLAAPRPRRALGAAHGGDGGGAAQRAQKQGVWRFRSARPARRHGDGDGAFGLGMWLLWRPHHAGASSGGA